MATSQDSKVITLHRPGFKEKSFFFLSGIIISVPFTLLFEVLSDSLVIAFPSFFARLLAIAIFAPLIEEFGKAYPLFYRHGETERSLFVLGFLVGLGFGISEFLVYIFAYGVSIPFRLPAVFFHAASTSIIAYGIATKRSLLFYLIAVALHFSNNFSALFGPFWFIGGVAATAITYFLSWLLHRKASERMVE